VREDGAGRTLWVAVHGQRRVSVVSVRSGREVHRIRTADGPSKVVFSPDGRLAYVNHVRAGVVTVVRVRDRRVIRQIRGVAPRSSDEALSPDGRELWLGHPFDGKTSVVDARRFRIIEVLDTGPRTNHANLISKRGREYAYMTVGGLDVTLVYRRGRRPRLVRRIVNSGHGPHGIWPSPDNTRIYVALQKSDAVDVIDTASDRIVKTRRVGQDPMALVYVAGAVRHGRGRRHLTRQGLGRRVETLPVEVRGASGSAIVTVREGTGVNLLDFAARDLPARPLPDRGRPLPRTSASTRGRDTTPSSVTATESSAPTSSTAAAPSTWAPPGATSTSPRSAARRSGRTARRLPADPALPVVELPRRVQQARMTARVAGVPVEGSCQDGCPSGNSGPGVREVDSNRSSSESTATAHGDARDST
jgi:YVTN family beta-propeller protein